MVIGREGRGPGSRAARGDGKGCGGRGAAAAALGVNSCMQELSSKDKTLDWKIVDP